MTVSLFASGIDHPEGIAWSLNGWIVCGGEAGQIYRIDLETRVAEVVASTGGFVLGIALDAEDNVYACDMGRKALLRIDPLTGTVTDLSAEAGVGPLQAPNFPVFHADGRLFFTDSGTWGKRDGRILCLWPDGHGEVVSTQVPDFTNGLAIDPNHECLYVVESESPQISRIELTGTGLGRTELVVKMSQKVPDGLAFAKGGELVIGCWRPDAIYVWSAGQLTELVSDWTGEDLSGPTNLAFVGPGLERLLSANLAGWHLSEIETQLKGSPLNYPRRWRP